MAATLQLSEDVFEGQACVRFETARWRGALLPSIGAKVVSLIARDHDHEWLWREPERQFVQPCYGASFGDFDISGWDECFPGIAEGPYLSDPWRDVVVPDHGELWTRAWSYELLASELRMWIAGERLPYTFERRVTANEQGALRMSYRVTNHDSRPLTYVWAAHPLFRVTPGTVIALESGVELVVDWSKHGRLGELLARQVWPVTRDAAGITIDLSVVGAPGDGTADKLFAVGLREGRAGLFEPGSGDYLALTFDITRIPNLGIWINQGGWPLEGAPSFNVALEPGRGFPDRLDVAARNGTAHTLAAHATESWSFELDCGRAAAFPRAETHVPV